LRNTPENVRIALIDPKILTFAGVEGCPYLWRPVATTLADALTILRDAVTEMDGVEAGRPGLSPNPCQNE
jgi:DNA segregation ATPase FtsK/SpoIIIE-like protein